MSTSRVLRPVAIFACAAALASGCLSTPSSEEWSTEEAAKAQTFAGQVHAGQTLFTLHCAQCHGGMGQGGKAPRLVDVSQGALPLYPPENRATRKTNFATFADVADFAIHDMPPKGAERLTHDVQWAILAWILHEDGIELNRKLTPEVAKATPIPR